MSDSPLDTNVLGNLKETLGVEVLSNLVDGFLERSDELVLELQDTSAGQSMYEKAHELKGMSANYGFAELSVLARELEDICRSEGTQTDLLIKKLSDANQRAKLSIAEWLNAD